MREALDHLWCRMLLFFLLRANMSHQEFLQNTLGTQLFALNLEMRIQDCGCRLTFMLASMPWEEGTATVTSIILTALNIQTSVFVMLTYSPREEALK